MITSAGVAFAVTFGVLLDTLFVRSLLVPALAYDLGGRIWRPGRLGTVRRVENRNLRILESIG